MFLPFDVNARVVELPPPALGRHRLLVNGDRHEVVDDVPDAHGVLGDGVERGDGVVGGEDAAGRVRRESVALGDEAVASFGLLVAPLLEVRAADEPGEVVLLIPLQFRLAVRQLCLDFRESSRVVVREQLREVAPCKPFADRAQNEVVDGLLQPARVARHLAAVGPAARVHRPAADAAAVDARADVLPPVRLLTALTCERFFARRVPLGLGDDGLPVTVDGLAVVVSDDALGDDAGTLAALHARPRGLRDVGNEPAVFRVDEEVLQSRTRPRFLRPLEAR